jgi:hypothetical protein
MVVGPVASAAGMLVYFTNSDRSVVGLYGATTSENLTAISPLNGHDWSDPIKFWALIYSGKTLTDLGLNSGPIPLITTPQAVPPIGLPNPTSIFSRTVSASAVGSWQLLIGLVGPELGTLRVAGPVRTPPPTPVRGDAGSSD